MMDLFTIIIALNIVLTFLLSPSASYPVLVHKSHEQDQGLKHSLSAFPRKLKLNDETTVKTIGNKHYMPYNMQKETLPEKSHHKEAKRVHARKGTRQQWMEEADNSHLFTMDYTPVRRRRPIHNKFVPVAP